MREILPLSGSDSKHCLHHAVGDAQWQRPFRSNVPGRLMSADPGTASLLPFSVSAQKDNGSVDHPKGARTMRLHYHPASTCSRRVLMTAHDLEIELDLVPVNLFKGEQNAPEFLQLNPNHRVPVLEHDGWVLWESCAIMQYLADLVPGQTLYPGEPRGRADVNRWLFWCGQSFMPGIGILNWENSIKSLAGMGAPDPVEVARAEQGVTEAANILEAHLGHRQWICDSGLSLADLAIAAPLADQHRAKFPVTHLPNLQRWFMQVQALDAWKQTAAQAL
ncbi:glutathione S-transferase family protein [Pseudomonas protegens]|nr:glutathione S-transferase family protein [Pseudomonas protegens]